MKTDYDFSKGKRGAVIGESGKTRVTLWLDNEVIDAFRARAGMKGSGYQTEINRALREGLAGEQPTLEAIRRVVREELGAANPR